MLLSGFYGNMTREIALYTDSSYNISNQSFALHEMEMDN